MVSDAADILTPPSTTAAMAYISKLLPVVAGSQEPFMATHRKAPGPARMPLMQNTAVRFMLTWMPASRAAFSLLPMAYSYFVEVER